jgi:Uma2 family endonuclease
MLNTPSKIKAEPTWEIATLFPNQGQWHESEYLAMETNRQIEFANGYLEVLPMPTQRHQLLLLFLFGALNNFVRPRTLGIVLVAAMRVKLWAGKYREPDVMFMLAEHDDRRTDRYWDRADLVMEIVSGSADDRARDLVVKRQEYAQAGIPEYWIIDPQMKQITVLTLDNEVYSEHGVFAEGEQATSVLLPGFSVDVAAAFDAANQ